MRDEVGGRFGPDFAAVFNTHIQMLEDKGFISKIEAATEDGGDALEAVHAVLDEYSQIYQAIEDPYFQERGIDVQFLNPTFNGAAILGALMSGRADLLPRCLAAYNTWATEHVAGHSDRLIPVTQINLTDVDWSVKELTRMRKAGSRARRHIEGLELLTEDRRLADAAGTV